MMTKPVVIIRTSITLQSSYAWFALTPSRLIVTDGMFTARLITTTWQTPSRQRIETGRALIAELAEHVRFAATLAGLLVADSGQRSIDVAATLCEDEQRQEMEMVRGVCLG